MLKIISERLRQKHRTLAYPDGEPPAMPDRFRGLPVLDDSKCPGGCQECVDACPTDAIAHHARGLQLDMGRCLFCTECITHCPEGAIRFSNDYRLSTRSREDLIVRSGQPLAIAQPLEEKMLKLFGRSFRLRQVSAGGSGSCEADSNVLGTVVFDMMRFGVHFVASPRHADGLLVTGPVSENMRRALEISYEAMPPPKIVIVVGVCAISGGPWADHPEVHNGADKIVPVDLYIPGFPPHPMTILDGLLRVLGRLEGTVAESRFQPPALPATR
jgi:Ni,Fe-hydrogenase III small subunit/NAD-dependent dihydropyrimidine dehydrogenase PreA subunit